MNFKLTFKTKMFLERNKKILYCSKIMIVKAKIELSSDDSTVTVAILKISFNRPRPQIRVLALINFKSTTHLDEEPISLF